MNKRIRELNAQAYEACKKYEDGKLVLTDEWIEKFAQAIVQECVDILSDYSGKVIWNDHGTQDLKHPIQAIKENFGVNQ